MHTSNILTAAHFRFVRPGNGQPQDVSFDAFCPDYHPQDRIAVVAPRLDEGVFNTAYALLACTTAFYDALRARSGRFFDYPQHFCILDADGRTVNTSRGRVQADAGAAGAPWSNLDVWPDCKWHTTTGSARAMLQNVFDLQINRIFWPDGFDGPNEQPPLPVHIKRILASYLKQVCCYNAAEPTIELHAAEPVERIVLASIDRLPGWAPEDIARIRSARAGRDDAGFSLQAERFVEMSPADFLQAHVGLFEGA